MAIIPSSGDVKMAFNVSKITNTGLELISAASATKTIVIDHIYCLSIQAPEDEILTQPPSYWANHASIVQGVNASVVSVGVDPNSSSMSRIVLGFTLIGIFASRTVKTVVVTAHSTEAGTDSEEMTFYGMADSTGLAVPYSSKTLITTQLAISFAFSRESSITVSGSVENYLLADEIARFVTTHGTSSTAVGESQDIYGAKTIKDVLKISNDARLSIQTDEDESHLDFYYDESNGYHCFDFYNTLEDDGVFLELHDSYTGDTIATLEKTGSGYGMRTQSVIAEEIIVDNLESVSDTINAYSSIIPAVTDQRDLGASTKRWKAIYTRDATISSLSCEDAEIESVYTGVIDVATITYSGGSNPVTAESSIIPKTSAYVFQSSKDLGASNAIWRYFYVSTVYCTSIYCSQSIGSESSKVSDIYADRIHGMTPYPSKTGTTVNVPFGCFVMAAITRSIKSSWSIGTDFNVSPNTVKISKSSDSGWIAGDDYLPEGKYRALHEGNVTGSGSVPCLLQRLDPSKT